jgi:YfiH family protein
LKTISLKPGPGNRLQFPALSARRGIAHFVAAQQNAATIRAELRIPRLYASRQIHSNRIAIVTPSTGELDGFDALVTATPGIGIAVSTADCVAILLYSPDRCVIAAVHAGWRGSALQIAKATVRLMSSAFGCDPRLILAGIAPSIGPAAFEVGEEVPNAFRNAGINISPFHYINPTSGKSHIDLKLANFIQLTEAGLACENIETSNACTFANHDFLSARRLGVDCGRMLTGAVLKVKRFGCLAMGAEE